MQFTFSTFTVLSLLGITHATTAAPSLDVSVQSSTDGVEINVQIEVGSLTDVGHVNLTALNATLQSFQWSKSLSPTAVTAHTLCATDRPPTVSNGTSRLLTAATQGIFLNSTVIPSATGSFRTPSQVVLEPFSRGSSSKLSVETVFTSLAVGFCHIFLAL
ncbi:hypothetical protein T440DRAFT_523818 [Plenodomus tracheiphilus IPT5]|uniref:Uncharacterized protein n=1 Tax=Plenodomus tracheiphilus IPT5 TaxID=1408161 RepID=A0A6A7AP07_9PLEO|nr:hypothetical protein T440DRAFT_523818 [Plenodomus tracheiphilus IPT5]